MPTPASVPTSAPQSVPASAPASARSSLVRASRLRSPRGPARLRIHAAAAPRLRRARRVSIGQLEARVEPPAPPERRQEPPATLTSTLRFCPAAVGRQDAAPGVLGRRAAPPHDGPGGGTTPPSSR